MVTLTIDNKQVSVPAGTTILDAARAVDIHIPTLCYLREINEVASCRVCAVEVEGVDKLATACNTLVEEGMVVHTNTQRVRLTRKTNVELILSQHVDHCVTCVRSGNCSLQALSKAMNIQSVPFRKEATERPWDPALPILRDSSKCIKCLRCVSVCDRVQSLGVWEVTGSGAHTTVRIRGGLRMNEASCALCGQCVVHCPVGGLCGSGTTRRPSSPPSAIPPKRWFSRLRLRSGPPGERAWGFPRNRPRKSAWPRQSGPWGSSMCLTPPSPQTSPFWRRAASSWSGCPTQSPASSPSSPPAAPAGSALSARNIPSWPVTSPPPKAPSRCLAPSPKAITARSWARAPRISSASP